MILEDSDLFERLSSPSNISVLGMKRTGRVEGATNLGEESKLLIGLLGSSSEETQKSVAETFGIDHSRVSTLSRGLKSDNETVDETLKARLDGVKNKVDLNVKTDAAHLKALDVLTNSLDFLKPKLSDVIKAKDLSKIASDMSRVANSLSGGFAGRNENGTNRSQNVQIVVHAPQMKSEKDFEVIEVKG